jgi:single-stranded-DNA-specific exonuclease
VLLNRGIGTAVQVAAFLTPDFKSLLAPDVLNNARAAAARLVEAARARRRIVIYGDYDVDGVTATSILWHALKLGGADVHYYIPSRLDEGYGLNPDALDRIASDGGRLVITVDCGVTAVAEAEHARRLGLELIITDHHEPGSALPEALLVHPTACPPACPNPNLSGAGVALKIAWALAQELCGQDRVTPEFRDFLLDATAFAALGLVADVVPLIGENRIIASYGLRHLRHTRNAGLRALIAVAGLEGKRNYDDYDVGFTLAPRLNAVGRMGHAVEAVELFTTADEPRAAEIARTLDGHNRVRQGVERDIVKAAAALVVERGMHRDGCHGIVLACEGWHAGVIGIAAARLVERFCRPAVLIALENGAGQGSGRSVRHFPLHEVLRACAEHLVSHGGHAMAAGLRLRSEQIEGFTAAFLAEAARRLTPADLRPRLVLDDEITLADVTPEVAAALERMVPFGLGNARPRLATGEVQLVGAPRPVGAKGDHLQFTVRQGATYRQAIAFFRGAAAQALADHPRLRLAFEPLLNEWNGQRRVELKVIDWKWTEANS